MSLFTKHTGSSQLWSDWGTSCQGLGALTGDSLSVHHRYLAWLKGDFQEDPHFLLFSSIATPLLGSASKPSLPDEEGWFPDPHSEVWQGMKMALRSAFILIDKYSVFLSFGHSTSEQKSPFSTWSFLIQSLVLTPFLMTFSYWSFACHLLKPTSWSNLYSLYTELKVLFRTLNVSDLAC